MRPLPTSLAATVAGYSSLPITTGCSASDVFHLTKRGHPSLYLKQSVGAIHSLLDEKERIQWLEGKLPVPEVVGFAEENGEHHLLISEVSGKTADDPAHAGEIRKLVEALAEGLLMVHAIGIEACPFDHRIAADIERGRTRMDLGLVNEEDFNESRLGRSAASLFEELTGWRPAEELLFTHGDPCLPNIILREGRIGGFIDLGAAGVGDRYRDLALASRSLEFNIGEEWGSLLFEVYGIAKPDREKIAFYRLLDEFF